MFVLPTSATWLLLAIGIGTIATTGATIDVPYLGLVKGNGARGEKASLTGAPSTRGSVARFRAKREAPLSRAEHAAKQVGLCRHGMVLIGHDYCIDKFEASLVELRVDGSEQPWSPYKVVPADVKVRAISRGGVYPQGYISGTQAQAACENSGKRLCKPEEWTAACMGPDKTTFPYGSKREQGRCNDNGRSPMLYFFPELSQHPDELWRWGYNGNMKDSRLNQLEGTLAKTGEHTGCTNEYGVFDMVGNLHEWVDDPNGTFRGGYYLDTHLNGDGCHYATTAHGTSYDDYSTGFRCCAEPDS